MMSVILFALMLTASVLVVDWAVCDVVLVHHTVSNLNQSSYSVHYTSLEIPFVVVEHCSY